MRLTHLSLRVAVGDAEFVFGQPDKALAKMTAIVGALGLGPEDPMPPAAVELYPDLFLEAVCGWSNLEGPDGRPLPFTSANAKLIPTEIKLAAVEAYLAKRGELESFEVPPAAPPLPPTAESAPATS